MASGSREEPGDRFSPGAPGERGSADTETPEHQDGESALFSATTLVVTHQGRGGTQTGRSRPARSWGTWCRELFFIFWVQEEPPRAPSCAML